MTEPPRLTPSTTVGRGAPLSADLGGELVLMSLESGKYYGLDEIGSEIWRRLETPARVSSLCGDLAAAYDAPADLIERDVLALLHRLLDEDLIQVKPRWGASRPPGRRPWR